MESPTSSVVKKTPPKKGLIGNFWKKFPAGNQIPGTVRQVRGAAFPPRRSQSDAEEFPSDSKDGGPDASSPKASESRSGVAGASGNISSPASPTQSMSQGQGPGLAPVQGGAGDEAGEESGVDDGKDSASSPQVSVKLKKFHRMLQESNMDMDALRKTSWSGIPHQVRGTVWQLLLGYLPANRNRRQDTLDKRRKEYQSYLDQYYNIDERERGENEQLILRQIGLDVPRTSPGIKWIQNPRLQKSLERMLYIWAIRHPASGYVQGINDLATPFYLVFLSTLTNQPLDADYEALVETIPAKDFEGVEADCFWCMTVLLDGIQDHYTFAQPGIQRMVFKLNELIARIDENLHQHFETQGLQFIQFAFRWMNCLLMREVSLGLIIRLWDTYLSEDEGNGFKSFHIYTCAAFLMGFAKELKEMEFQDLVLFLQSLPTDHWTVKDIESMLSQAYIYQTLFDSSPHHLQ